MMLISLGILVLLSVVDAVGVVAARHGYVVCAREGWTVVPMEAGQV